MKCGLALFSAILQLITTKRRFRRHEYRFHNHSKGKLLRVMILQSISTSDMNTCNILQTEMRQERPEIETEMEEDAYETSCESMCMLNSIIVRTTNEGATTNEQ